MKTFRASAQARKDSAGKSVNVSPAFLLGSMTFRTGGKSFCRQKLDGHVAAGRLEVEIRGYQDSFSRVRRELYREGIHVRNSSLPLDHCRADSSVPVRRNYLKTKRT